LVPPDTLSAFDRSLAIHAAELLYAHDAAKVVSERVHDQKAARKAAARIAQRAVRMVVSDNKRAADDRAREVRAEEKELARAEKTNARLRAELARATSLVNDNAAQAHAARERATLRASWLWQFEHEVAPTLLMLVMFVAVIALVMAVIASYLG